MLFVMWCAGIGLGSISESIRLLTECNVNVSVGKAVPKVICEDCTLLHVLVIS
jgi:hypothetical protein